MSQSIRAVFQGGVFRPFEVPLLAENQMVTLTVEEVEVDSTPPLSEEDPLAGIRFDGPVDLAENFDDYRFGRRSL